MTAFSLFLQYIIFFFVQQICNKLLGVNYDTKAWFNVQMQDIYGASGYFSEGNTVKKEELS